MEKSLSSVVDDGRVLREKELLNDWVANISIGSPKLLLAYSDVASYLDSLPLCRFAVNKKERLLAMMSHDRELEINELEEDRLLLRSSVKVLVEQFPEWCLLEWSDSGLLLLSTRSNAVIDVFDNYGGYCYSISLNNCDKSFDAALVISDLSTIACNQDESKWLDTLYILQFDGTFSCFKIGRLAGYFPVFKVDLGQNVATSFVLIPSIDILVVSCLFRICSAVDFESISCNSIGLNLYRVIEEDPFVIDVKATRNKISAWDVFSNWLPFKAPQTALITNMVANQSFSNLACISSAGNLYILNLPSMQIVKVVEGSDRHKPCQVIWSNKMDLYLLTSGGALLESDIAQLQYKLFSLENDDEIEVFDPCTKLFAHHSDSILALEAKLLSTHLERSVLTSPNYRTWLVAKLNLSTLYRYFKAYVGVAVGQPLEDVPASRENRKYCFKLHHIHSITLSEMLNKLLSKGKFTEMVSLARKNDIENLDFIYKEQWKRLGQKANESDVSDILAQIRDTSWVVKECTMNGVPSYNVQRALVDFGLKLSSVWHNEQRVIIVHCARILNLLKDDIHLYFQLRFKSLIDIAFYLSKSCRFEQLERLISDNYEHIQPHMLSILWAIPAAVAPSIYEDFIPSKVQNWIAFEGAKTKDVFGSREKYCADAQQLIHKVNSETDIYDENECLVKYMSLDKLKTVDIISFIEDRCYAMDSESGLVDDIIDFLLIAINHGFTELQMFMNHVGMYRDYILFCGEVTVSLKDFMNTSCDLVFNSLSKHMSTEEVCTNAERLLQMLNARKSEKSKMNKTLCAFLTSFSRKSIAVLARFQDINDTIVTEDVIHQSLMAHEGVGQPLINALKRLRVSQNLRKALRLLFTHNVNVTYRELVQSCDNKKFAEQFLIRMVRNTKCKSASDWAMLKDDILTLHSLLYTNLFGTDNCLRCFSLQILDALGGERDFEGTVDYHAINDATNDALNLVLSFDKSSNSEIKSSKLTLDQSISLLVEKSNDYLNAATASITDSNLRKAHRIVQLVPPTCEEFLRSHLNVLEAIDIALELGCTILPVKFKCIPPYDLIADIIEMNDNYKQEDECMKLARLLHLENSEHKVFELCATRALKLNDVRTLRKYCKKWLKSAKAVAGVHKLCMDILHANLLMNVADKFQMKQELLTCALMNCPTNKLLETLDECRSSNDSESEKFPLSEMFRNTHINSELVLDAMYTPIEQYTQVSLISETDFDFRILQNHFTHKDDEQMMLKVVRAYTQISASVALYLSLSLDEKSEWTENVFLNKYAKSIRELNRNFPIEMIGDLPVSNCVSSLSPETIAWETTIERILHSGCDRERFFEDKQYREDTLYGIAICGKENVIADCIEVAEKYAIDVWVMCMSVVSSLLTDPSVSEEELEALMNNKILYERLHEQTERLYSEMRDNVLPKIFAPDHLGIKIARVYFHFFKKNEVEGSAFYHIVELAKQLPDCDVVPFLRGDAHLIAEYIETHTESFIDKIPFSFKMLPKWDVVRKAITVELIKQNKIDQIKLQICYNLVREDFDCLIGIIDNNMPGANDVLKGLLSCWSLKYPIDTLFWKLKQYLGAVPHTSIFSSDSSTPSVLKRRQRGCEK